jgi:Protein of unknown function (DUF3180)
VTPTRPRDLLAVALVTAVVAAILIQLAYGTLPPFPLLGGATPGVLGIAEAIGGSALRARIRQRPGTRPVQPLVAARAVLVAKASAVAGAVMSGLWIGLLVNVLPHSAQVAAEGSDAKAGVVGLVCALALVGGALWLEHCCRTPDDEQGPSGDRPEG